MHHATPTIDASVLEQYCGQTILITGGRGFIGAALTQALSSVDCHIILLDRSARDVWKPEKPQAIIRYCQTDITDSHVWEGRLDGVDVVFHLAAQEYYYGVEQDPLQDLRVNGLPLLALVHECTKLEELPRIVFTSSANLYGKVDALPVNEETPDNLLTPWAIHKALCEQYLKLYSLRLGIQSAALRLANVYGPTPRKDIMTRMVINRVTDRALNGRPLRTYKNRTCIRDYVFIHDVIRALLMCGCPLSELNRHTFVIGSGEGISIADTWQIISETIEAQTGMRVVVESDDSVDVEEVEMRNFVADTTSFEELTGWQPRTMFKDGLAMTVANMAEDRQIQRLS